MRIFPLLISLAGIFGTVAAQANLLTTTMTCEQTADLVSSKSAVILSTGQFTFDRYVASQAQCAGGEVTEPAWVPTSDSPQCFIGYTCNQDRRR